MRRGNPILIQKQQKHPPMQLGRCTQGSFPLALGEFRCPPSPTSDLPAGNASVDVDDVCAAHVLAVSAPAAHGRYLLAERGADTADMAAILRRVLAVAVVLLCQQALLRVCGPAFTASICSM